MAAELRPSVFLFSCALLAIACESGNPMAPPRDAAPPPFDPDASLPPGITPRASTLYRFDTTRPEISVPIAGEAGGQLLGRLRDRVGRRELSYRGEVFAPADWHLPPAAAVARSGTLLVCFNTLTGTSSPLSSPEAPDPLRGMILTCRARTAAGAWSAPTTLRATTRGVWLQRVVAREDGTFRVLYFGDDGYFIGPRVEGHGVFETIYAHGELSPPRLVVPAVDSTGPESEEVVDAP